MSDSFMNAPAAMALVAIPSEVVWSYFAGGAILVIGLLAIFLSGDWRKTRGFDKLILFGTLFYAAPLAAFGTEHFTQTAAIASLVPSWIPWHRFWAYFVGACFIAAPLSLVTRIQARLAASLLALTFFLFVVLMDVPGWVQDPHNRIVAVVALRELAFSGGALALASSLTGATSAPSRAARILANVARYFIAAAVLFFSFEQFRHGRHVAAIPLEMVTPKYVPGRAIWTYLVAATYVIAGIPLLLGKKTRAAAGWVAVSVIFVELVVYVPIAIVERAQLEGLNYLFDTLMFAGAVLLLAGAMPRKAARRESPAGQDSKEASLHKVAG